MLCSKMVCGSVNLPRNKTHVQKSNESTRYTPPPEFLSGAADTLTLARQVQENMLLIKELTEKVSQAKKKDYILQPMKVAPPLFPLTSANMESKNISDLQESINSLRNHIKVNSISQLQSNTEKLILLSKELQKSMQHGASPEYKVNSQRNAKGALAA